MKPVNKKLKPHNAHPRQPRKTKDDFLRWLGERRAVEKLEAEKQATQAAREMKEALMVWVDDGGSPT
jgi:hypothetical protein